MSSYLKSLYHWTLSWAYHPAGAVALGVLALAESSFFPIPPDLLLIALCLGRPTASWRYALICTLGSLVGGIIGYGIGMGFMEVAGNPILAFYGLETTFGDVRELFLRYDIWIVGIAGFTPIPYKVFTISAGACHIPLLPFLVVSALSRGARFFAVATLLYFWGEASKRFIDRYFNWLSILFVILLVGGVAAIRFFF